MKPIVLIASPLVGAGIGYITNWLAIKMLFRPLKPVKLFGKEISMLQGVIPKRRGDLARSVGQTVGEHLLTEDAFDKTLESPETQAKIRQFVRDAADNLQKEERTIDEIIEWIVPEVEKREQLHDQVTDFATDVILNALRSEETLKTVEGYLTDFFNKIFHEEREELLQSDFYQKLKMTLRDYLTTNLQNPLVAQRVSYFLYNQVQNWQESEECLGSMIPNEVLMGIKTMLEDQGPKISRQILNFLSSPETRSLIRGKIDQFFSQSMLMAMVGKFFADKGKIADQIVIQVSEFIDDPHNQRKLVETVNQALDSMLDVKVGDLAKRIDKEMVWNGTDFILQKVTSKQFIENCLDGLEELFLGNKEVEEVMRQVAVSTEIEMIPADVDDLDGVLTYQASVQPIKKILNDGETGRMIQKLMKEFLDQEFVEKGIRSMVESQMAALRQKQIKSFFSELKLNTIVKVEEGVLSVLRFVHKNYLSKIIEVLNFETLVEEKVLSFDLEEMEEIVLRVMSVELRMITLFGLYLGLLMGFITPLINMLLGQ